MRRVNILRLLLTGSFCLASSLAAGEPGQRQTIAYVQKLQTPSGGFLPAQPRTEAPAPPGLRATSAAVRTLRYLGAPLAHQEACSAFVASCHDPDSGGFRDVPQGKVDVFTTAVGLMAVAELKMPREKYAAGAVRYLTEHASSFEDIRIAAAGLEAIAAKTPKQEGWRKEILALQNDDGTFGKGAGQARATGGSVVALLRLGGQPADTDRVLKVLRAGQRRNGGYGKEDSAIASDLETTYRVMRCFVMLKARPGDVEGIRSFVAKCRNEDGGYGVAPGQPSSVSGTYYASIITYWLQKNP